MSKWATILMLVTWNHVLLPLHHLLQLHPHDLATAGGLQQSENFSQTLVPHLLQVSQQTSLKEHL